MSCWKAWGNYYFGQATFEYYICADSVSFESANDSSYGDAVVISIDGNPIRAGYGMYFSSPTVNAQQHTPTREDLAQGRCTACPCPPNHCNIRCDASPIGYCCLSHSFLNGLIEKLS
jgi:hypothetical protein